VRFADELQAGVQIVRRAIEEPMRQIIRNAGLEGAVIVGKVREGKDDSATTRRPIRTGIFSRWRSSIP